VFRKRSTGFSNHIFSQSFSEAGGMSTDIEQQLGVLNFDNTVLIRYLLTFMVEPLCKIMKRISTAAQINYGRYTTRRQKVMTGLSWRLGKATWIVSSSSCVCITLISFFRAHYFIPGWSLFCCFNRLPC